MLNRFGIFRAAPTQVDRAAGRINGYAVISRGEAMGHDVWIDQVALAQIATFGAQAPSGIKSRFTHPGLCSDGLGKFLGRAKSFRLEGDVVRADMHFADIADKSPEGKLATYVMDLADEDPDSFGTSIVFDRDEKTMREFSAANPRSPDPLNVKNLPHIRFAKLRGSDVVDDPASGSGFFGFGDELASRGEAALNWLLDPQAGEPNPMFGQGDDVRRLKTFFHGYLNRHSLAITSRQETKVMGKVAAIKDEEQYAVKCACGKSFKVPMQKEKFETTCPYCNKTFDETPKPAGMDDPPKPAPVPAMSAQQPTEAELRAAVDAKAAAYASDFDAVMTASGFNAEEREAFRKKYSGKPIADVREFATLTAAARTKAAGEGGGAQPQQSKGEADLVERFSHKDSRAMRKSYGVHTDDANSDEFKKGLARYLAAHKGGTK